jgi:hypothetical protein
LKIVQYGELLRGRWGKSQRPLAVYGLMVETGIRSETFMDYPSLQHPRATRPSATRPAAITFSTEHPAAASYHLIHASLQALDSAGDLGHRRNTIPRRVSVATRSSLPPQAFAFTPPCLKSRQTIPQIELPRLTGFQHVDRVQTFSFRSILSRHPNGDKNPL